jgi:hypothetical protein
MRTFLLGALILVLSGSTIFSQTVIFSEDFESVIPPDLPSNWTQEKTSGSVLIDWETLTGGHQGNPASAYEGLYNAMFQYQSSNHESTILIAPPINLTNVIKPELRFAHAQDIWYAGEEDWDQLKVYYKRGADSSWILLEEYLYAVTDWEERAILLPDSSLSSTYYIGFEGITGYGHGTCIDAIEVVETGVISLYVESVTIKQNNSNFIPTGTDNNPILRIEFNVLGNTGTLILDSISINSLNTSDEVIVNNGVKLYVTKDTIFSIENLIATSNFTDGTVDFDNLGFSLTRGITSVWLTYDIKEDLNHEMYGSIADAMVKESAIKVENSYYPFIDKSPNESRVIYESIFIDNFETDKGWRYTGEFERAIPEGLHSNSLGNADPGFAHSGEYIIGTDLTDDGNYSNGIMDTATVAEPPAFNFKYYNDITFTYYRWLNVQSYIFDRAKILVSTEVDTIWEEIWGNPQLSILNENIWSYHSFDLSDYFKRNEHAKLKFTLGPTNSNNSYTGWNIDDVIIVGNYISKDVGITNWIAPLDGCGHTSEDHVEIRIQNYAGDVLTDSLIVSYSFDGGLTVKYDTIPHPNIAVDGFIDHIIDKPVDLTTPGWYNNIYATTHLAGDEDNTNNKITKKIFITPTYTLPYTQNFEANYGYYLSGGTNSTWEYGTPTGTLINNAASGSKAWVTNLDGEYETDDSSFLVSPCFDFSGVDSIVFEFKCKGESENQTDGLSLLYSLDAGINWNIVPDDNDFYWSWYTEPLISELELPGIDETYGVWTTFKQLLPPILSNKNSVKFKFVFESNESSNLEGFGIDDIKVYEAPADVGVSSIDEPVTQCELSAATQIKITIENYGITTLSTGSKIPVGLDFQGSFFTNDTLELVSPLAPGETVQFTLQETLNMANAGDYNIVAYTRLETNPYFYNNTTCNDTSSTLVTVQGMPNYNPFPEFIGVDATVAISVDLNAGAGYSYLWSTAETSQQITATAEGIFSVTVTKTALPTNCQAEDAVEIIGSRTDITINSMSPILTDLCERTELTELSVNLTNNGLDDLVLNDTIFLAYQVNELPIVEDTLAISPDLNIGANTDFTFTKKCNLMSIDEYTIKVFHNFAKDLNPSDDTVSTTINTWGLPELNLAFDTIYSSQADTLTLDAGSGFASYTWNSGSVIQTETPSNISYYYKVTVTDVNACGSDKDSTYIETHDLGILAINSPSNTCEEPILEFTSIDIEVENFSDSIYSSANLKIFYEYDGGIPVEVNPTLNVGASGVAIINNIGTIDTRSIGEHTLIIYTSSVIDANHSNDTLKLTFETFPNPDVELAYDTIYTTRADTVKLIAQNGFATYNWSNGSTNDTLAISKKYSEKYVVTVTDNNGCGSDKDSTQIIAYNLSINSLVLPKNECSHSNSESVIISIKNSGNDTIRAGTVIPIGYILDSNPENNENYTLGADLLPSKTTNYTFTNKANLSAIGTYKFKLYVAYDLDVNNINDTLVEAIKTFGYPEIELGDDIYTMEPETISLVAPSGFVAYNWSDGSTNPILNVTYLASRLYSLTVTDINGCTTNDAVNIYTYDVGISSINTPFTTCEFMNNEELNITILNNSEDTLLTNETIDVSYSLNGGIAINEIITLAADFLPGTTVDYSFTSTLNLTTATTHNIEVSCAYPNDVNVANDNLSVDIDAVGYPSFSLGEDIYTTNPVGTVLSAPGGYASYEWQDASTNSTFTISNPASAQYAVTVTDAYGCEGSDVIEVYTYNIAATELIAPVSQCELSSSETVSITIMNNSQDLLLSGETINASYTLNSGTPVVESFNLSANLLPGATVNYTFTQPADLSANQTHEFELFAELASIDVETNDAITRQVIYQKPILDLGSDVNTGSAEYTIDAGLNGTYASYLWFNNSTSRYYTVDINDQNPNHYYAVEVTNSYGCTDEDSIQVTFTTTPDLAVTSMTSPVSDCWNEEETYPVHIIITNSGVVNLNPGASFTVGYRVDGGTAKTETFNLSAAMDAGDTREHTFADEISFSSAKVYKFKPFVKLADDGNVSNDTLTTGTNIDISAPEVILGANDTISFTSATYEISTSESYLTYLWTGGSTESTLVISETGSYSVTVTDQYGCQGVGSIYCKKITTGIDHVIQGDGYQISYYPNPASEKLMIQIDNQKSTDIIIEIVSSSGQILYNNKLSKIENSLEQIDVSPFARGVYYFKFKINDEVFIRKIILQ